jgi:hypothetical protein
MRHTGLAGLCAAIARPQNVLGVQLINISLRGLHVDRQAPWQRPLVAAFQRLLRYARARVCVGGGRGGKGGH